MLTHILSLSFSYPLCHSLQRSHTNTLSLRPFHGNLPILHSLFLSLPPLSISISLPVSYPLSYLVQVHTQTLSRSLLFILPLFTHTLPPPLSLPLSAPFTSTTLQFNTSIYANTLALSSSRQLSHFSLSLTQDQAQTNTLSLSPFHGISPIKHTHTHTHTFSSLSSTYGLLIFPSFSEPLSFSFHFYPAFPQLMPSKVTKEEQDFTNLLSLLHGPILQNFFTEIINAS